MSEITFKINGNDYNLNSNSGYGPDFTLNEFIRNVAGLRGTKAMCHEGGCGACIVAVTAAIPPTNEMKTFAVNSCLVSILSCHGWEITTTEGIGSRTKGYHEIQSRLAKFNGTQCGYCTPGWVMNMYSLLEYKGKQLTMREIENSFAGNICRCTGYRPIADAFKSFASDANKELTDKLSDLEDLSMFKICGNTCKKKCHKGQCKQNKQVEYAEDWSVIGDVKENLITLVNGREKWFKAYSLDMVFTAINKGDYKLIAGNTGQGIYHVTSYPTNVIDISSVADLKGYTYDVNLILNAGMSLTEMMEVFLKFSQTNEDFLYLKQFNEHMDLVAHLPVKNIGTIGGNLFLKYINNDFQSDLFVLFETVGAMLTIVGSNRKNNTVSLPNFLQMDMQGKLILNVILPPLSRCCSVKTYKIMPRSQNAHAIVNIGVLLKFHQKCNILEKASIVYGGIASKFIHASKAEAILAMKDPFDNNTLQLVLKTLYDEIEPEEAPPEPSPKFRKMLAVNLFYKAILSLCPDDKLDPKYRSGGEAMKRHVSKGTQIFDTDKTVWPLNKPIPKIEALVQCSGEATFANDLPRIDNEVFAAFVTADAKAGSIISGFDTTEAFKIPGVTRLFTAKDIPGDNTFTPNNFPFVSAPEEILCATDVKFFGQPVAIIIADREKTAAKAANLVKIIYSSKSNDKPLLTVDDVLKSNQKSERIHKDKKVEPKEIGNDVTHTTVGNLKLESQYPYHMETQVCVVLPTEEGMEVYSSTQWIEMVNVAIAQSLDISVNSLTVIVRRVGGAYGAKISRGSQIACCAALVTHLTGKPCRFILPLETNMHSIGKRIPTTCNFNVKTNNLGEIQSVSNIFYQDCGSTFNENITSVTILHIPNCYESKRWSIEANSVRTDTASNTWVRSPSSMEGVAMTEYMMEKIAYELKVDPIKVRQQNIADDNPVLSMIEQVMTDSKYLERVGEVKLFNDQNRWRKRAIKLVPLSFDIFYYGNFNAVISIYHTDGSVTVTHAGVEMGQGINTKTAQVCAFMLGVPLEKVNIKPSNNVTSPNAMVTGSSIGSDCVPFATAKACQILMDRLRPFREKNSKATFQEVVQDAYASGIDLQASYMFSPNDGVKGYDVYAVCVLELEVDILTGNHEILRVDILEDVGRSISPEIDVGQIEGAFVMGLGYWTSEKLIYDESSGQLLTDRTWTYKPPGIKDIPADMRIYFRRNARNEFGVLQSKATGEPALCLATVVLHALREAVQAARLDAGYPDEWLDIGIPCTVENIFMAVGHKLSELKLK